MYDSHRSPHSNQLFDTRVTHHTNHQHGRNPYPRGAAMPHVNADAVSLTSLAATLLQVALAAAGLAIAFIQLRLIKKRPASRDGSSE
jgi:hypothetical protein